MKSKEEILNAVYDKNHLDLFENQIDLIYQAMEEYHSQFTSQQKPDGWDRSDFMDKVEEITDNNYKKYKGQNEAELITREEIADLVQAFYFSPQPQPSNIDWDEMRNKFFAECVEDKKVCFAPHDLFEWIKKTYPFVPSQNPSVNVSDEEIEALLFNHTNGANVIEESISKFRTLFNSSDSSKEEVVKWISVEDRLPEKDEIFIGCGNGFTPAIYQNANFKRWEITHWMPLPKAPELFKQEMK